MKPTVESLRAEHHAGILAFIATARAIPNDSWDVPRSGDKWSPGQIAEHLRLSYVRVEAELSGGDAMRVRTSLAMRMFVRVFYLPRILRSGKLPKGARAPWEIRPGAGPFERRATLAGLEAASMAFEIRLAESAPGRTMTHPIFGRLSARRTWRFLTVHAEHHRRQLLGVLSRGDAPATRSAPHA